MFALDASWWKRYASWFVPVAQNKTVQNTATAVSQAEQNVKDNLGVGKLVDSVSKWGNKQLVTWIAVLVVGAFVAKTISD